MWKAAGLEEPPPKAAQGKASGSLGAARDDWLADFDEDEQLENLRNHPQWQRM